MHFDLLDLELFLHVAETGSITAGAQRSNLALASASARIKGLEDALSTPLLTRGRRGVSPTAAGLTLVRHAREVLLQVERLRAGIGESSKGLRGIVRLLCGNAALAGPLPEMLSAFLAGRPLVDISIEERPDRDIPTAITLGKADMGIVDASADTGALETIPFHGYRLALVTARAHPLAALENPAIADALDHDFVGLADDAVLEALLADHAARSGKTLKLRARLENLEAVCRMVERNAGIALMPASPARRCGKSLDIQIIGLTEACAARQLTLCLRKREELPGCAMELLEYLKP